MATSYKVLSDGVMDKLKSVGIPNLTEEQFDDMIYAHIRTACVKFKSCKQDLSDRNNQALVFNIDLTEEEIEILVFLLTIEYLTANYINVPSLLRHNLPSKDWQIFSAANHLASLEHLRDTYKKEVQQMMSIYSNQGSGLFTALGGI